MTYVSLIQDPTARRFAALFALRMTSIPASPIHPHLRTHIQAQFVHRALNDADLPILATPALEFRVVAAGGPPRVGMICAIHGYDLDTTRAAAGRFAAHVQAVAEQVLTPSGYALVPAEDAHRFGELVAPMHCRDYAEVRPVSNVDTATIVDGGDEDVTSPFAPMPSLNAILTAVERCDVSVFAGVTVAPAPDEGTENVDQAPDRSERVRQARTGPVAATATGLDGEPSKRYFVRLHIGAAGPIPTALASVFAAETIGFGRYNCPHVREAAPWMLLRPRNARRPGGELPEYAVAGRNRRELRFDRWSGRDDPHVVPLTSGPEDAFALFALPENEPAISHLFTTPDAHGLPAPSAIPSSGIVLGTAHTGPSRRDVALAVDDRRRHLWVIGQTGTGKTTLLETMIAQDIAAGAPVVVVEPHGDLTDRILGTIPRARAEDVIVFDPSDIERPVGLNLLEASSPDQWSFLVNSFIGMLYQLYDPHRTGIMGPRFEHAARNAMLTVMAAGGTLVDVVRALSDEDFARGLLPHVQDPLVRSYWEKEVRRTTDFHKSEVLGYFVSKFARFSYDPNMRNIVGQPRSAFDIRDVIESRKILLVKLAKGRLGAESAAFLGAVILSKLLLAALSRSDLAPGDRHDAYLYVDELQAFGGDAIVSMLAEARKYGLAVTLANQHAGQLGAELADALIGNAANIIAFRTGWRDALAVERALEPSPVTAADIASLPNFEAYARALAAGVPQAPFLLRTRPASGTYDAELRRNVQELSRLRFGRDRSIVEAEIARRAGFG